MIILSIKLIVFDWNGTVFADTVATYNSSADTIEYFTKKRISINRFRETFEVPIQKYYAHNGVEKSLFEKNQKVLMNMFHKNYEKREKTCRSRSGIKKVLEWLNKNKIEKIILSNHTTRKINSQLKRIKLNVYFDKVLANDSHYQTGNLDKKKRLMKFLKENKFKKDEVLIIGDTVEEINIAENIGIKVVSITSGFNSANRLKKATPDYLINNMAELISIVEKEK